MQNPFYARISTRQLIDLLYRVGTSLRAGVDIRRAFATESNRGKGGYAEAVRQISERVDAGHMVHEAMNDQGKYFPRLTRELVEVGETTGRLDEVMLRLAEHYRHLLNVKNEFLRGIFWPVTELVMAVAVIGLAILILGFLAPGIDPIGFGTGVPGLIKFLTAVGFFFGMIVLGYFCVTRGWFGSAALIPYIMKVPGIGTALQTMALGRMAWTFSMSIDAGVDARKTMDMALRSTENPYYMSHLEEVDQMIVNGHEFHETLRHTGKYPEDFLVAMETAETTGTHSETMRRIADDYQEQAMHSTKILAKIASFAVWACVAAMIISAIFKMFFFIQNIQKQALDGFL